MKYTSSGKPNVIYFLNFSLTNIKPFFVNGNQQAILSGTTKICSTSYSEVTKNTFKPFRVSTIVIIKTSYDKNKVQIILLI